jgi:hypothetical protein
MSNEFSKAIWGTSNEEGILGNLRIRKSPPNPEICNCGKKPTKALAFGGEVISYLCDDCAQKRQKKLDDYDNDPKTITSRKEWKERIELNKRIACRMGGCEEYCGEEHNPFIEVK